MKIKLIVALFTVSICSCAESMRSAKPTGEFQIPIVINSSVSGSVKEHLLDSLLYTYIPIKGKYKFTDTIDLAESSGEDWDEYIGDDFKYDTQDWIENDSLDVNGFEMFLDYSQTILYGIDEDHLLKYYPVFFVNSTSSVKIFTGHDFKAVGVQQATFGVENWRSINKKAKQFLMCGNGYMYIKVHPGEIVMLLVRKYTGDYRPQMRLAIKNGQSIYVYQSKFDLSSSNIMIMFNV